MWQIVFKCFKCDYIDTDQYYGLPYKDICPKCGFVNLVNGTRNNILGWTAARWVKDNPWYKFWRKCGHWEFKYTPESNTTSGTKS